MVDLLLYLIVSILIDPNIQIFTYYFWLNIDVSVVNQYELKEIILIFLYQQKILLSHQSTHKAKITPSRQLTRSHILSNGRIAAGAGRPRQYKFHLLKADGTQTGRTIDGLCAHKSDDINMLSLIISAKEYLAVSCCKCYKIHLIDIKDRNQPPKLAYQEDRQVGAMCKGPGDTIYTASYDKLSLLNCERTTFKRKHTVDIPRCANSIHMCYVPSSDTIVLGSWFEGQLFALTSKGEVKWEISVHINNYKCALTGLVYISKLDSVLVADCYNRRILAASIERGEVIQTINVGYDIIDDLDLMGDKLLVQHRDSEVLSPVQLSYYTVSKKYELAMRMP